MKKKIILLPLVGLLIYVVMQSNANGPGATSSVNGTGSRGVSGCSCHNASSTSSTTVVVELLSGSTPVTTYTPGGSYNIRITGTQTSGSLTLPRFGFQVSAVLAGAAGTGSASLAGTFGSAPSGTHVVNVSGLNIFEHTGGSMAATTGSGGSGTTYVATIPWTAPSAGTGSVVLYGVVNAVNADGSQSSADKWNTASPVTICETLPAIAGTTSMCVGATTTLTHASSGGTWSTVAGTGSVSLAASGTTVTVTGVSAGTASVSYTTSCGAAGITVTVQPTPAAIGGTASVCQGSGTTLTNSVAGGTWTTTSGTGSVTLSGSGTSITVTGTTAGNATVSYTIGSCAVTRTVTVVALPSAGTITGPSTACVGSGVGLSNATSGGSWSVTGSTGTAIIGSTGIITGVTAGAVSVTYAVTSGGCSNFTTKPMTVNPTPGANSGTATVCMGGTTTITNGTGGGTWSAFSGTGSVSLAPSGASVTVTGVTAGTASLSYTIAGCAATTVLTVDPLPSAGTISGGPNVCLGGTTILTNSTAGGTWSSSASGTASVAGAGTTATVSGVALGSATITYTTTSGSCSNTATRTMTVQPNPSAITGTLSACAGAGTALSATPAGGTWSSSAPGVASVDGSGNVLGITGGVATITYTLSTGCFSTASYTVNALPSAGSISGPGTVCVGANITHANSVAGGTWSSSAAGTASVVGAGTTATVTGVAAGPVVISYLVTSGGCTNVATRNITVNTPPAAITGSGIVCQGQTTGLTGAGSGTWASSTPSVAAVTSPGTTTTVNGISAGTSTITFTLTSTGCSTTREVTVNPMPTVITGTASICAGSATTLGSTPAGGTWASNSPAIATIGSADGIVNGLTAGTSQMSYTLPTGCKVTRTVTVNANPGAIGGTSAVCVGATGTVTNLTPGGTWSSSDAGTATINSTSGVVTGVVGGAVTITYTLPITGCTSTKTVSVNTTPSDFSGTGVCVGSTLTLSSTPSGGTWSSSNPTIASINASTGEVTGGVSGIANITYTADGCVLVRPQTVHAIPAAISGFSVVCESASITITDPSPGGTWSATSGVSLAAAGTSATVTGVTAGTATVSYTSIYSCSVVKTVTVNANPGAITGLSTVCEGQLIALGNSVGGGTWTSGNTARATIGATSGVVTALSAGAVNITYTLPGGCTATTVITVNPIAAITGLSSLCGGSTTTLSNAVSGGTWGSSDLGVATINSTSGLLSALTSGETDITYSLPSGCNTTITVTVISAPSPITGNLNVCVGSTTTLSSPGGGEWTSSATGVATVGSATGEVSGLTPGTSTIMYSLGTGCTVSAVVTVNPNPAAIGGASTVCESASITLTNADAGGTWSVTGSASIAGTGTTATLAGTSAGAASVTYTLPSNCYVTHSVVINPRPSVIGGTLSACQGNTTTLSSTPVGGTWSSSTPSVATIDGTLGTVTGINAGMANISYTEGGCTRTALVTIDPLPAAISGPGAVCVGSGITLSTTPAGGTWGSSSTGVADIGITSGMVTGMGAGTATISYSSPAGCLRTRTITVNPLPVVDPITGTLVMCAGDNFTLTSTTTGGVWSSSGISAMVNSSTGVVTGIMTGTTDITYTVTVDGCTSYVTTAVTVSPSPAPITGVLSICSGESTVLSNASGTGSWTSSNPTVAGVTSPGDTTLVTSLTPGTTNITYTLAITGCTSTATLTVNAIPLPGAISGPMVICVGSSAGLTSTVGGGVWSSTGSAISIGATSGVVSGLSAGSGTVTYTVTSGAGCVNLATRGMSVDTMPVPAPITGANNVCAGATITLASATAGGTWSSSNATATVGTTGIVTGVTAGTDTIHYTVSNTCVTATVSHYITINPLPVAGTIVGTPTVCVGATTIFTNTLSGGTWSSSNAAIASVASTGVVTGVAGGVANISYTMTNGCGTVHATMAVTVTGLPPAGTITGPDSVCVGASVVVGSTVADGVWTTVTGNAFVDLFGNLSGVIAGTDTLKYTVFNACGWSTAKRVITVRPHSACNVGVQPVAEVPGSVKVYPNPSNGTFTVEIPGMKGEASIVITDVLGKTIETRTIRNTDKTVFNLSNLAAGSYLVRVNMDGGSYRQKVIIH